LEKYANFTEGKIAVNKNLIMEKKHSKLAFLIIALLITLAACGGEQSTSNNRNADNASKTPPLPAATIDELASGKKVYETNCMICHKEDGTGGRVTIEGKTIKPENLTEDKFKKAPDEKLIQYIMDGVEDEGMPAFKNKLSEGEMRDVVKYIRTSLQKSAPHA
jgi:mono/diheme cytochrome c family protein